MNSVSTPTNIHQVRTEHEILATNLTNFSNVIMEPSVSIDNLLH